MKTLKFVYSLKFNFFHPFWFFHFSIFKRNTGNVLNGNSSHILFRSLPASPQHSQLSNFWMRLQSSKLNTMESLLGHRVWAREYFSWFNQTFPNNNNKKSTRTRKAPRGNMVRGEILRHPEPAELSVSTTNHTVSRTNKTLLVPSKGITPLVFILPALQVS